jgi:hypothetical protein
MPSYTDEELNVFRMCIQLKKNGCKTSFQAEKEIYRRFWNLPSSKIHILVRHWFFHREKIDLLLNEINTTTQTE